MKVVTVVPIVHKTSTHGEAFLPCGRNISDLRCDGLPTALQVDIGRRALSGMPTFQAASGRGTIDHS
jgi:hypothetical protein